MTGRVHLRAHLRAALTLSIAAGFAAAASVPRQAHESPQRVRPAPRFRAGQTLHYQIDFRTETSSHTSGAVEDPQGASELDFAVSLLVRLDVLSTLPAVAAGSPAPAAASENHTWRARLRATYEKSSVTVRGDSYDPAAGDLEAQYRHLQGRAMEFTLESGGAVEDVTGLDDLLRDQRSITAVRGWLSQLAASTEFPREGIAPGDTWSSRKPMPESPLKDTALSTNSTYLRNEKCRESAGADATPNSGPASARPDAAEMCAVIVTHYEMKQQGSAHGPGRDATPEVLRKRGLRSSGTWTSTGESLSYLSLPTGFTVSVTQSGAEHMNMIISRAAGGLPFQYSAQIRSETHLTLVPESAPVGPAAQP